MSGSLKSKVAKLEQLTQTQPQDAEAMKEQRRHEELAVLLEMREYHLRMIKLYGKAPQSEDQGVDVQLNFKQLSTEAKADYLKKMELQIAADCAKYRVWLASDERKQFDLEYSKRFGSGENV